MAEYNQNSRYQQLEPVKRSGSKAFWPTVLIIILFVFAIPALEKAIDAFSLAGSKNYYQLSPKTPEVLPLGPTLGDGSQASYGDEFYLVSVYVENNSAYDAYVYSDSFRIRINGLDHFPEPWNEEAEGAFVEWNSRELFPAQRGKELVLLFQLPEDIKSAELVYPATSTKRETVKAVFLEEE